STFRCISGDRRYSYANIKWWLLVNPNTLLGKLPSFAFTKYTSALSIRLCKPYPRARELWGEVSHFMLARGSIVICLLSERYCVLRPAESIKSFAKLIFEWVYADNNCVFPMA